VFNRVFVINLDRNPDRWSRFQADLPEDWPFGSPERFIATDGRLIPAPQWWKAGHAAWGCFRSHYRILEEALNTGTESILVLEDDAVFVKGFSQRALEFIKADNTSNRNWDYQRASTNGSTVRITLIALMRTRCADVVRWNTFTII
jgi:GR25 family glycosyltransferase involved in LPS biosynthesis